MRCDVFIKTWYNDLSFCSYCLRFLEKNWREPDSKIIVLANSDCKSVIDTWGFSRKRFQFYYVDPWPDGNQFQCYLTLLYDHFSDAELFVVVDSDCMLTRPLQLSDCLIDGKPVINFEPPTPGLPDDRIIAHRLWYPVMRYWVGLEPEADYMFAFPFLYRAETIRNVRRLITQKTGKGLLESLYSATPFDPAHFLSHPFRFCEHNVISFWAASYELDGYFLRDINEITEVERAHWPVKQYHSWTQWSAETQAELEQLLKTGCVSGSIRLKTTAEGWTILDGDLQDGHSGLVERLGRIDIDVGSLPTHDFILPYLKPGSVVIDAGAHIGNFTVPMMRALGKNGLVIAYEPHPTIFQCLEANVLKERTENPEAAQCLTIQAALGPGPRAVQELYCNPVNYASNTILPPFGFNNAPTVNVEVVPLDDLEEQREISFIKMDVEGGELGVLHGAEKLLARWHPILFMETYENSFALNGITEEEFFAYLRGMGYQRFVGFPQAWINAGHHAHDTLALP